MQLLDDASEKPIEDKDLSKAAHVAATIASSSTDTSLERLLEGFGRFVWRDGDAYDVEIDDYH